MTHKILVLLTLPLLLALSSCAGGGGTDAEVSQEGMGAAVDEYQTDVSSLQAAFESDVAFRALSTEAAASLVGGAAVSPAGALRPQQSSPLPTGVHVYDGGSRTFVERSGSDDLVYVWTTDTNEDTTLVVDWDANGGLTTVDGAEAFTGMNTSLTVGSVTAADVDVSAEYDGGPCEDLTRLTLDGYVGVDARLTADTVTTGRTAGSVDASGTVTAASGGDSASVEWDVVVNGTFYDESVCDFLADPEVVDGTLAFGASSSVDGETRRFDFDLAFGDVVEDAYGSVTSVDVDGSVSLGGTAAVVFSGTLDDADGDGMLGDNVQLAFSNGDTTTLAAFLQGRTGVALRSLAALVH